MKLNSLLMIVLDLVVGNVVNLCVFDNVFSELFQPAQSSTSGIELAIINVIIYVLLPIPLGELIKQGVMKIIKSFS